jgi:hypothetical protein
VSKETTAVRADYQTRTVGLSNTSIWGITLGDLRKVVVAADGIGDDAAVSFVGHEAHYAQRDEHFAKRIIVREAVR